MFLTLTILRVMTLFIIGTLIRNLLSLSLKTVRVKFRQTTTTTKKSLVCYCCQFFFHVSMNCHINPKSVRCGNPHLSQQCTAQLSISTKIPP